MDELNDYNRSGVSDPRLRGLRAVSGDPGDLCPLPQEYILLAEHDLDLERERKLLDHAASCDHCAVQLRESVELTIPLTVISQEADSLRLSRPNALARLAGLAKPAPNRWVAAAAAVLMGTAAWWLYSYWNRSRSETEITQAFAQDRSIEYRLDALPYGPYDQTRSRRYSPDIPTSKDASGPASWRMAILEGDLDGALGRLAGTARNQTANPKLLNDEAAVHAARGDRLRLNSEYGAALTLLDHALALDPRYAPALFNKMIVLQRLEHRAQMRAAALEFLSVERDPHWRSEAESVLSLP